MSITVSTPREFARPSAPATVLDAPGSTSLADLLDAAGAAIEALPSDRIEARATELAVLAGHLVDAASSGAQAGTGAQSGTATDAQVRTAVGAQAGTELERLGRLAPAAGDAPIVSLRALARLAARTAATDLRIPAPRAARIHTLISTL